MTIENIKSLKDKVYELEGLLELAQLREDKIDELAPLIEERIKSLTVSGGDDAAQADGPDLFGEPSVDAVQTEVSDNADLREDEPVSEPLYEAPAEQYEEPVPVEEPYEDTATRSVTPEAAPKEKSSMKKPAFCLNDRFRFRRELFNNSDAEFSDALARIASMESYEEAEEYFVSTRGWDPENPEVMDFLEIIKIYFEG